MLGGSRGGATTRQATRSRVTKLTRDLHLGIASLPAEAMEAATTTAPRPVSRAPERRLPPSPPLPRPIQTAIWSRQARRMLYACQDRYGDMFTLRIAYEGTWVMLADPAAIKQVFTGDPKVFHAGEGNQILAPSSARTRSSCSTRSRT